MRVADLAKLFGFSERTVHAILDTAWLPNMVSPAVIGKKQPRVMNRAQAMAMVLALILKDEFNNPTAARQLMQQIARKPRRSDFPYDCTSLMANQDYLALQIYGGKAFGVPGNKTYLLEQGTIQHSLPPHLGVLVIDLVRIRTAITDWFQKNPSAKEDGPQL